MAPLLIDGRDLIKYGIITVLTTVFTFAGGVFYGYKSASSFYLAGSDSEPLLLPVKAAVADQIREPKVPETIVAGAEIDVDQPDSVSSMDGFAGNNDDATKGVTAKPVIIKQSTMNAERDIVTVVVDTKSNEVSNKDAETIKVDVSPDQNRPQQIPINQRHSDVSTELPDRLKAIDIYSLTPDELNDIKYSVQVGMYGRLANAKNMMQKLQAIDFDAYVSDFTNKKNETRYHVRFGYFRDKRAAKSALRQYRQSQKADGYLVKFTADSMTKQSMHRLVKNRQPVGYDLNENKSRTGS